MKTALVTGATGFLGSNMIEELVKNEVKVYAVARHDSPRIRRLENMCTEVVLCDMDQYEKLPWLLEEKKVDIDICYHFAWRGVYGEELFSEDAQMQNQKDTVQLLKSCEQMGIKRIIVAGSIHEIEGDIDCAKDGPIENRGVIYKAIKQSTHRICRTLASQYGICLIWPLITNTYGVGERSTRLIINTIRQLIDGISPELSSGEQLYDFVYISDLVKALYKLGWGGIDQKHYMIGSGRVQPLKDYMMIVQSIVNPIVQLSFGVKKTATFIPRRLFDYDNLRNDIDWEPFVSFEEGIEKTK